MERQRCKIIVDGKEYVIKGKINDGDIIKLGEKSVKIVQKEETVLEFSLSEISNDFVLGYMIGNYHLKVMINGDKVYVPMEFEYLLEKFKAYDPKVKKIKFQPNVELPVSDSMIKDFK
ncbi:urease accessory protein UreE [Metallosphaera cuprina Ar-4]|uniref:Urease accessory protein UreE n=2 Tax=Sulfolobales TaxID=2281 RepID=F4G2G9_METCR|nr:urease accessory protein UreE [Metallosphaera cuprina Ar-4]